MSPIDPELLVKIQQWVEFAEDNLRFAKHGLTLSTSVPYRLIAYHAQQCAEKYLKAYLVSRMVDFPHTHNIGYLLEVIREGTSWMLELEDAEYLTTFSVTTRYPGIDKPVTKEEAITAIQLAEIVAKSIIDRFIQEGIILSGLLPSQE